jgi:ADP-heptose:LPS heptosyltransferase
VACHGPLVPLLATLPGVAEAIPMTDPAPAYDRWILLGSVPRIFDTELDNVPFPSGFLQPDPARRAAWAARLPASRRVGLVWAGNPAKEEDAKRSLPLAALAPVLATPGIRFVSLQVGPAAAQAAGVPGLLDVAPALTDFAETASCVAGLDLVISVDTAIAHLAGALGVPCWLLCPDPPDWRWLLGREDSPWYASLRLFRQPRPGDWEAPIARVAAALATLR